MIDIHSHLLFGIDDGPSQIEDSIKMLMEAKNAGIREIICTVHHQKELYESNRAIDIFIKLDQAAKFLNISLKLGYEVFVNSICSNNINRCTDLTLGDSKFLLIEFPFGEFPGSSYMIIDSLLEKGFIPVFAHPERCRCFFKNYCELEGFLSKGCLIQVDTASIIGVYGKYIKSFTKYLIKEGKVSFVASNAHFAVDYNERYEKAFYKVKKWAGISYAYKVFESNAEEITGYLDSKFCNMS